MIRDEIRTNTYRVAIMMNGLDFKDKVVLDVGCGTSILSFFCAQAGAKKVYAIDASDIADQARRIVEHNGMSHVIEVIKGRVEEIELPEKVDVIVSEWMGYFLLYESMFESVILARDKFLKPDGKMYPSKAHIYLSLFNDDDFYNNRVSFWRNIYGIDFTPIIPYAKKCAFEEPTVEYLQPHRQLSFPTAIKTIDCKTVTKEELQLTHSNFKLTAIISANFNGFASWFDVVFEGAQNSYVLTTSPEVGYTHWKQTLFWVDEPIGLLQDDVIEGSVDIAPSAVNKRFLTISIQYQCRGKDYKKVYELR
eukprot:TRINITY_DN4175_c0_g1_i1.p1 TRINITY_DN4175_c0_g1~~TRINITY_DN4175_c0_g1_i1.p1  ORF type:complete len:307 (-),score=24.49 TRINITY_DN4175_c0_g1_i1:5-925(-)